MLDISFTNPIVRSNDTSTGFPIFAHPYKNTKKAQELHLCAKLRRMSQGHLSLTLQWQTTTSRESKYQYCQPLNTMLMCQQNLHSSNKQSLQVLCIRVPKISWRPFLHCHIQYCVASKGNIISIVPCNMAQEKCQPKQTHLQQGNNVARV